MAQFSSLRRLSFVGLSTGALLAGCQSREGQTTAPATRGTDAVPEAVTLTPLRLASPAFAQAGAIPKKFTCEGGETSPPLEWSDAPAGTQAFALVVDDPDAPDPAAPQRVYVHWVLADIPGNTKSLTEGVAASGLPAGTVAGKNDWGKPTYGGPCPPIGRHRYFFKLYALDRALGLSEPTKADLEKAMQRHILGKAELVGTYQKSG
jgi:hypothetical protein